VDQEFAAIFGRSYGIIEAYRCDDAELMVITSSTVTSTAREVIDRLRDEGRRVGLLKIRLFRPFPAEELRRLCAGATKLAVIDRNIGFGVGGIFAQEVRAALYNHLVVPVYGFIAGLGGRDITPETILEIVQWAETNEPADSIWIGVKR
jgi:pyruvate ferredoxin oxidoreductase alpha subunit